MLMRNKIPARTVNILKTHKIRTPKQVLAIENRPCIGSILQARAEFRSMAKIPAKLELT